MSLAISGSGLSVERFRQQVSANNLANVSTDNFRSSRVRQNDLQSGGSAVDQTVQTADSTTSPPDPKPSNVDVSGEVQTQLTANRSFSANVSTMAVQDKMTGTVLDLMA